ncbi:MAG: hypothetical protein RLZZ241_2199 [Bacteroidota bacterium]|jgi:photosystem II stability/assembly factor-like uncharacterized protein
MKALKTLLFSLFIFVLLPPAFSQRKSQTASIQFKESLYNSVRWRLIGPFRGGRAGTVTGVVNSPNVYYMGTAGGGVWKTEDAGNSWKSISDGFFGGSIGAVAVSESDPNVIFVGEGEQTLRGNVSSGNGLWKSTDAGNSWKFIGLEGSEHISRIRIHPNNPDLVYAAVIGNLWKPSPTRGVYRSQNGGLTWERVLYVSDKAGAGDLIMDPNNPRILYAATWQMTRNGYRMDSGGPDSRMFKSTDGGDTWTDISENQGLPGFPWGITGIAVSPVNSKRLWAIIEAENGGIFRSEDGGSSWSLVNKDRALRQRAWYYSRIYADTQQEDRVYVMNVSYGVSSDGGKTFELRNAPHGDHHDLWIDPKNNQRMIIADDGGAQISNDGGNNWSTPDNQPTAQFYRVVTDNHFPYRIYGAQQDNTTVRILHRTSGNSIDQKAWEETAGGESAHLAPDPKNNNVVYGGTYKGYMMRVDHGTDQERSVNVWPDNPAGSGAEIMKYRFNWNFPIGFSLHNPNRLYAGSNFLHATENEGQRWRVISPDLTRNKPETIASSGGPITQDNTGAEFYSNLFVIAESPQEPGVIWVGSDDGLLHITRDDGNTWENITPPALISPELNMFNCIDPSPFAKGTAYVAASAYKFGDYTPYLYKTTDYGKTWKVINKGIPNTHYTRAIRSDKVRQGLLYAGTEWGMYVSFDDGESWRPFQLNLPITSIRDLHVRDNDLIAATHGRSFWMIDDLTPLQQLTADLNASDFHLYAPDFAYRMPQSGWGKPDLLQEGENHPNGALIHYYIKDYKTGDQVRLEILDAEKQTIRQFSNTAKTNRLNPNAEQPLQVTSGGNLLVWDLRHPGFTSFEGMVLYSSPNVGPKVAPGNYTVRLTYNGIGKESELEVKADPRLRLSEADYLAQEEFLLRVRDQVSRANEAVIRIRKIKKDIQFVIEKAKDYGELIRTLKDFEQELYAVENAIHMTKNQSVQDPINYGIRINNRLAFLLADSQRGDFPPTVQAQEFFESVREELNVALSTLDQVVSKYLSDINAKVSEFGIPMLGQALD